MIDNGKEVEDNWAPQSYQIPEHWLYVELETAFENLPLTDKKLAQKNYDPAGKIPVIDQGASEIGGYSNDQKKLIKLDRPVIIFGDHTKCLKYITFEFIPGADGVKVLLPNLGVDPKFAFYACKSLRLPDRGYSRHYSFLKKCNFPLPPFNEQKRIVAKIEELFSELDSGITALKSAREQLKAYRYAVLKHAFEGKLTAKWREENVDKLESSEQLLTRILQEREIRYKQQFDEWKAAIKEWEYNGKEKKKPNKPKKLVQFTLVTEASKQEFPQLPACWSYIRLGNLIDEPTYGTSVKCDYETGDQSVLRIPNISAGKIDDSDLKFANFEKGEADHLRLMPGDILTIRSNGSISLVGSCALINEKDIKHIFAGYLIRLRANKKTIKSEYLLMLMGSHLMRKQIEFAAKSTSGVNNINSGELQNLILPLTSIEEQEEIVSLLDSILPQINSTKIEIDEQLAKAEILRQSILKKAFSGQLVAQDPNDEPASELLLRIKAEKEVAITQKNKQKKKHIQQPNIR
ncbi:restriction endonuclease subunit S [Providencia vermicola]|uniref:restriction endonuclease subunit S n=1 Tax=Providencia vermicola TaxID=333965 RepID=UPI0032DA8586